MVDLDTQERERHCSGSAGRSDRTFIVTGNIHVVNSEGEDVWV